MADDAELAFLAAQKEYDPTTDYQPADDGHNQDAPMTADDDEEYDPAIAFSPQAPSDQSASIPPEPVIDGANASDTTPPLPSVTHEGENGLQLPSAVPSAEVSAAPTPSKQPRTMGGFVVESEDDEDEEPVAKPKTAGAALLNASGAASNSPQRSLTHTPNNTLAQNDVQLHSAQDQGAPIVSSASIAVTEPALSVPSAVPNGGMPVPDSSSLDASFPPHLLNTASAHLPTASPLPALPTPTSASAATAAATLPQARLPHDRVGILEDRIAEDPRGDIEAWLSLIDDYRRRHKEDDARAVFERFFKVFPAAGEQWIEYVKFETELEQLGKVEQLFGRAIPLSPHVPLYKSYIDYTRRRFNLITDQSGQARSVLTQVYEFVLDQVGIDVESGQIWLDYIEMLKSGPGTLGGTAWQDMQKMDTLRKLYQRAVSVPHGATLELWRDYDRFEMSLNKTTGRKYLQDKSAAYMTARSAINVLDNVTKGVNRTTLPKLPPAPGFDGHDDYMNQVKLWKNWIQWEKGDPLECATDDKALYHKRILHLYKSALMALRFWPELWFDAAEWCFQNDLQEEGEKFLNDGIDANPESCLLAFRKGYQVELRTDFEEGEQGVLARGKAVREPYNKALDALYELTAQTKKREEHSIARAKEAFEAQMKAEEAARANDDSNSDDGDDDEVVAAKRRKEKEEAFAAQVQAISAGYNAQVHTLKKTLSFAWIALMRAMRRVQGKGGPGAPVPGFRGVFAEARKKGKLLSDAYVASALIEHHCYQDQAANKIFERGMKLFPDDEQFALEYIKHLIKINDSTNARAVFETVVTRLIAKPENVPKVKPLFVYFHEYESQFGELAQILKLEQRMATLFPEDPQLQRFAERFAVSTFDPTTVRPIISPRTQMRPVMPTVVTSIEEPLPIVAPQVQVQEQRVASPAVLNSPRPTNLLPVSNSPKRPLEDADDGVQPRKLIRGESPLKGAAGRRLDAARRNLAAGGNTPVGLPPAPLPREITFLLSIIPAAHTYKETRFNAERMVAMLRGLTTIQAPPGTTTTQQAPTQASPINRWGTTATTAAQLQDIQARYGQPGPGIAHGGWGA